MDKTQESTSMNTNVLREAFINLLYNQIDQNQWLNFRTNKLYRIKLNMTTIALLDLLVAQNNLSKDQARWLFDSWTY